jgi:hypothetical protein
VKYKYVSFISLIFVVVLPLSACGPAKYTLNTAVSPEGAGTITPLSDKYEAGTKVTLTAEPASGYAFDRWSGDVTGTASSIIITMDSDKSINANFKTGYTLNTSVNPSGGGTVSPASGAYGEGAKVNLVATPANGYAFYRWDGDASGTSNPITITMNSARSVTALFRELFMSSDGQVGMIVERIERVGFMPDEFDGGPPPKTGYDYVCVYLVFSHLGSVYLDPYDQKMQEILLEDAEHNTYKAKDMMWKGVEFGDPLNLAGSAYLTNGTKDILLFELPKQKEPFALKFAYFFKGGRGQKTVNKGQIDIRF